MAPRGQLHMADLARRRLSHQLTSEAQVFDWLNVRLILSPPMNRPSRNRNIFRGDTEQSRRKTPHKNHSNAFS
jgi:hypothetical protein